MSSNYRLETDLKEAEVMAENLADYVRGDKLYGNAGGGMFSQIPSLTVGALLMRLRRLDVLRDQMKDHQSKRLDTAIEHYITARREWTHHYEEKMMQEAHSRVDAMRPFFDECADNINKCGEVYRPELLRRTTVQEILKEMHEMSLNDDTLMEKINSADMRLKQFFKPSSFQWADELKAAYPEDEFWWLYQAPQA